MGSLVTGLLSARGPPFFFGLLFDYTESCYLVLQYLTRESQALPLNSRKRALITCFIASIADTSSL